MYRFNLRGIVLSTGIWLALACHKTNDSLPELTISLPVVNQSYTNGDTITIKGTLTDDRLHELQLKILRTSDQVQLYEKTIPVHNLAIFTIDEKWKSSVAGFTNASVVVSAIDMSNNLVTDTINISIQP